MEDQLETATEKNLGGRPQVSEDEKDVMLRKLEPYLKSGLGIRKALLEANLPIRTFYNVYHRDESFRNKIDSFKQYLSILLNSSLIKHMHELVRKQAGYKEDDGTIVPPKPLDGKDLAFLEWFALNSNLAKEEFGERKQVSVFDPEAELQKMKDMIDSEMNDKLAEFKETPKE